jgi:predicted DNA-binding transcriptional regulator AlpA
MTEVLFILIAMFVSYIMYRAASEQKKPTTQSSVKQVKPEQPIVPIVSQAKPEQPIAPVTIQVKPEKSVAVIKPSTSRSAPKNAKVAVTKPVVAKGNSVPELVGMTAGSIWSYLDKNGPTTVAKLVRELPENEKTIQRSIGWLAQEGKITLKTVDRAETISLKE